MPSPPRTLLGAVALVLCAAACVVAPAPGPAPGPTPVALPSSATPTSAAPVEPRVVVLDPGHNGGNGSHAREIGRPVPDGRGGTKPCNTTGTSTGDGYPEHAFAWDVAGRVRERLVAAGVTVVLTRPDDVGVGPCVDERGAAGEAADADAVVSIHADGSAPGNSGFHVAFSDPPLNPAQEGPARELGVAVRDALRGAGFADSDYIGRDGLSPRADLAGLNLAARPTVLVECANMRNADEAALLSSPSGRDRYAAAIADGILAYLARAS